MSRILAVEDQEGLGSGSVLREQLLGQKLLVVVVDRTFDVSAVILVLETAIHHPGVVVVMTISAIEHLDQGGL